MSEQPQEGTHPEDIQALASEIARRRLRLVYLNLTLLAVPVALGAWLLTTGKSDRDWVRGTVDTRFEEKYQVQVQPVVEINKDLENRVDQLEEKLAPPPEPVTSPQPESAEPAEETAAAPDSTPIPSGLEVFEERVKKLEQQQERLEKVELALQGLTGGEGAVQVLMDRLGRLEAQQALLTNPDQPDSVTALRHNLEGQQARLDATEQRILDVEAAQRRLDQERLAERLRRAEAALAALPRDLGQQLSRLQPLDQRVTALEGQDLAARIDRLRQDLERIDPQLRTLQMAQDEHKKTTTERLKEVNARLEAAEKSAFRSTLLRENDSTFIPSLGFDVEIGRLQDGEQALSKARIYERAGKAPVFPLPMGDRAVRLDEPVSFSHKGCRYTMTVRQVVPLPLKIRDYMEILIERECRSSG